MRSKTKTKKETQKDPLYQSEVVSKLVNRVMTQGKKTIAQKHVYKAFELLKEKTKKEPLAVFEKALDNINLKWKLGLVVLVVLLIKCQCQ
jgi:small subunit ribosomal protein S7